MAELNASIEALASKIQTQATVVEGVKTLIAGLKDQLEQLEGTVDDGSEAAVRIDALIEALDANTSRLAEALVANTEPSA